MSNFVVINKPETKSEPRYVQIVYNGKVYGEWNQEANSDFPEDLIFGMDLDQLVEIGVEIGKQIERDGIEKSLNEKPFEFIPVVGVKLKRKFFRIVDGTYSESINYVDVVEYIGVVIHVASDYFVFANETTGDKKIFDKRDYYKISEGDIINS